MRFSVDAHAIGRHLTGNEVYVRNLLQGFASLDQNSEFIAYLSANIGGAADCVPTRFRRREVSGNSFLRLGVDLSRRVREDRPDLLHVQYTAPLACPVPVIVSVHDISFLEHPEFFSWQRAVQLRITVKQTMANAARVLTPSEFSRSAILRAYPLDPARVEVVPIAVSPNFRPVSRDLAARKVREAFQINTPYIVNVGDLQPRKNQIGLIDAFEALIHQNPGLPHGLVIVGKNTWFARHVHERAAKSPLASRIHFTNWVSDEDLVWLYNASDCFVFPSFYEGFGLPILEAMACGRAVACSGTSSIPEVADSAALLFDPGSPGEIVRALRDLLLDHELRARMERLGQQRASLFTWEHTARRTLQIYYEVAGAKQLTATRSTAVVRR
ncbi:MAG: glycosyltransferase family 4 protein [Bryobacteraceae bacterium]|nr:glycosyltransferase family 4 protein [Bryobacteraceae bacterium]